MHTHPGQYKNNASLGMFPYLILPKSKLPHFKN